MRKELTDFEKIIHNDGERLIFGVSHNLTEDIRHRSSYLFFKQIIEFDCANVDGEISVVDFGCGVGHGCETLSSIQNSRVLGVDISQEALQYASQNYGNNNIQYEQVDLIEFSNNMEEFDYVVSRGVLEHIHDGLSVALKSKWAKRLIFDVPYDEAPGNPHHLITGIREEHVEHFPNAEIFYQDLNGVIYDRLNKPQNPNMIICVCSADGLPKVETFTQFPIPAWRGNKEQKAIGDPTTKLRFFEGDTSAVNDHTLGKVFSQAKGIYDSLMDEKSKKLFALRMLYNTTLDNNYLFDMVALTPEFDPREMMQFRKLYNQYKAIRDAEPSRKLIIYGSGKWGRHLYELTSDLNWHCFCDKDIQKQNTIYCGLPVISPEQLISQHKNDFIVIGTKLYQDEVRNDLISLGFPAEQILSGDIQFQVECFLDTQYFEEPIISPQEDEVFVDAGCFNFDTSLLFKEWCDNNYKKIYAFEPDPANYKKIQEVIKRNNVDKVELFNAGVWSERDVLHFNADESSASSFSENGSIDIDVVSLDDVLDGQYATFIKMDVEGCELEALKGAKNTIIKNRPRLAICIYHKPEDILEIPLYLQSLIPDYKFYIRHYSNFTVETVLYAI
ncbi:FkbM family methyltransferase [Paenibacillus sp. sgz500958]|uniref:FkbM family methyltransferase n=1 Tax=Paenibacillus sp. sgz500958 TaxID=3242475 RepID=UPI0036D4361A